MAFDTDMAGPLGYFADVSRTYLCGDRRPTAEQQELYEFAYATRYLPSWLYAPSEGLQALLAERPSP